MNQLAHVQTGQVADEAVPQDEAAGFVEQEEGGGRLSMRPREKYSNGPGLQRPGRVAENHQAAQQGMEAREEGGALMAVRHGGPPERGRCAVSLRLSTMLF
ncbi:MAG: hypothetical protein JSS57_13980 [Proteobacteria bacterium]|nr:hypothetical protein [Pseudomonadota bacterium]